MSLTIPMAVGGNVGSSLYEATPAPQTSGGGHPFAQYRYALSVGGGAGGLTNLYTTHAAYQPNGAWITTPFQQTPWTNPPPDRQGPFGGSGLFYMGNGRLISTYLDRPGPTWQDDVPRWMYHDGFGLVNGGANQGWVSGGIWPIATPAIQCSGQARGATWILYTLPSTYPNYNAGLGDLYIAFNTDLTGGSWESHLVEARVFNGQAQGVWLGNEWLVTYAKESGYWYFDASLGWRPIPWLYQKRFSHYPCATTPGSQFVVNGWPTPTAPNPGPTFLGSGNSVSLYDYLYVSNIARNDRGALMCFPYQTSNFGWDRTCFVSLDNGATWSSYRLPYWVHGARDMGSHVNWRAFAVGDAFAAVSAGFHRLTHCAGIHTNTSASILAAWP